MADQEEKHWTFYLRPIWIGTIIGVALGLLVYVVGRMVNVKHTEVWYRGEGLTGSEGGYSSAYGVPALLGAWGFGIGLLIAVRKRVLRYKEQTKPSTS